MPVWLDRISGKGAEFFYRKRMGIINGDSLNRELKSLLVDIKKNHNILSLSDQPGWHELDEVLSKKAVELLKQLPKWVIEGKDTKAKEAANWIEAVNDILGLVNRTVYSSKLVASAIDSRITMKEKLQERLENV